MLTKYEAIRIAKQKALEYKLSWSDKNLFIKEGELNRKPCYIVSTMNDGCDESDSWLDFKFSSPNVFYINSVDGALLAYDISSRGVTYLNNDEDNME